LNPKISPTIPPGFGIGHSPLFSFAVRSRDVSSSLPSSTNESFFDNSVRWSSFCPHLGRFRLLGVRSGISPSAYAILGAGHGKMCGKATTKKLAKRVVANNEEVTRLRGCRCGGMVTAPASGKGLNEWIGAINCKPCGRCKLYKGQLPIIALVTGGKT
jgi:hypothetical protein